MERTAIFPGSFDPFTRGHAALVDEALNLFDRVIIGIGNNTSKQGLLTVDSQMAMFGYFKDGFEMAPEKPGPEPKAAPKPQAAAAKAVVKPVVRQRAALRPKRASLLQSLFGRGKK